MNRLGLIAAGWVFVSLSLVAAEKPAEGWVKLFDGKSLTGWKANEVVESFSVKDGAIVAHGQPRSHLYYVGDEKPDQELKSLPNQKHRDRSGSGR
jgi:hypothetical protein